MYARLRMRRSGSHGSLRLGHRDHEAEVEERQPWMTLIQEATKAGKGVQAGTDYFRARDRLHLL
jgi:hypothetical protein